MADEKIDEINIDNIDLDKPINGVDFAKILKNVRENYVPKSQLDAANKDIQALAELAIDGGQVVIDNDNNDDELEHLKELDESINTVRERLLEQNSNRSNLEIATDFVKLRDLIIERDGKEADPTVPRGNKISATAEDYEKAQNVADVIKQCIEYSNGDSKLFTNELYRRTDEAPGIR